MSIADNIARVRETIAAACARANRAESSVALVAVSKTHSPARILEALAMGVQHFGENRVEESSIKIPQVMAQVDTPITWHMIGHIQSRKAKDVPALFQMVHSVDSVKLAEKLANAVHTGQPLDVLLEINISGEVSKAGFIAQNWQSDSAIREALWQNVSTVCALPALRVQGLMTMPPIVEHMEAARPIFAELAALRSALVEDLMLDLPQLSMGMTDDYPVAIEEGATLIRVGRAIFGERERGKP